MILLARRRMWWVIPAILLIWGCKEDLGIEVDSSEGRTRSTFVELNLPVTNVYFDSIRTDKIGHLLVGEYSDATYGKITTESYFEYQYFSGLTNDSLVWMENIVQDEDGVRIFGDSLVNLTFDAAVLRLKVNAAMAEAFAHNQEIIVETLADTIYSDVVYLNDSEIPVSEEIGRGMVSFGLDTLNMESDTLVVSIDVTSEVTEELFRSLNKFGTDVARGGLKLSSNLSNGILGFDINHDTTVLELQIKGQLYDTTGIATLKGDTILTTTLRILPTRHFINVSRDLTGSALDGVQPKTEVEIDPEKAFFHPLAGIYPVVDLQPFLDFAESEEQILVTLGTLKVLVEGNPSNIPQVGETRFYFPVSNGTNTYVNWPALLSSTLVYENGLLIDRSYLGQTVAGLYSVQNDTISDVPVEIGWNGNFNAFWQLMHQNVLDQNAGIDKEDREFPGSTLANVNRMVLVPPVPGLLGQSTLQPDGITITLHYVKIVN